MVVVVVVDAGREGVWCGDLLLDSPAHDERTGESSRREMVPFGSRHTQAALC